MSLTSLADQEIIRTEPKFLQDRLRPQVSLYANAIVQKLDVPANKLGALTTELLPIAAAAPMQPTPGSNALDALARYIPTEAITLYVAACSTMEALKSVVSGDVKIYVYWGFVVLTPILFLLIFAGKRSSAKLPPLPPPLQWPWWKLIASTLAFGIWALAVPNAPYLRGELGGVVAAFLAVFVSTFLALLQPIFERP